jgi:hypothetical protein
MARVFHGHGLDPNRVPRRNVHMNYEVYTYGSVVFVSFLFLINRLPVKRKKTVDKWGNGHKFGRPKIWLSFSFFNSK